MFTTSPGHATKLCPKGPPSTQTLDVLPSGTLNAHDPSFNLETVPTLSRSLERENEALVLRVLRPSALDVSAVSQMQRISITAHSRGSSDLHSLFAMNRDSAYAWDNSAATDSTSGCRHQEVRPAMPRSRGMVTHVQSGTDNEQV